MGTTSIKQSRRKLLLAGGAAAAFGASAAKAQVLSPGGINLPEGLGGFNLSPPVDTLIETPAATGRLWDAVLAYVKTDTELLAPRVEEFSPADPPMPYMKSIAELEAAGAVFEADLERSNANGKLEAVGQRDNFLYRSGVEYPNGFILNIPPGEYLLERSSFNVHRSRGYELGPRFVFNGRIGPNGEWPVLNFAKSGLAILDRIDADSQNAFGGLEVRDLEMKCKSVGSDAGPGTYLRYFRYDNVLFSEGFKNGNHPGNWPGVGIYNNCTFARSGRGDGLTHTFYGSYVQSLTFRNCLFTSPRLEGHPFKAYAQNIDMRGCTIANWWHEEDLLDGYYGAQTPMDIGAWGQSFIQGCHFVRRGAPGNTRNSPFVDYRNRLYEKYSDKYQLADFGTDAMDVDYHSIDNEFGTSNQANPADQLLFRHVLIDNKFYNGVLPNGQLDPEIDRRSGFLARNNGTIVNWSHGKGSLDKSDPNYHSTPTGYTARNERAVLYVRNADISGVPVDELFPGPYGHTSDPAPVVDVSAGLPDWIEARVAGMNEDNHWWDTGWNSSFGPPM